MTKPEYATVVVRTVDELRAERRRRHRALLTVIPVKAYNTTWTDVAALSVPTTIDRVSAEQTIRDHIDELLETDPGLASVVALQQRRELEHLAKFVWHAQNEAGTTIARELLQAAGDDVESMIGFEDLGRPDTRQAYGHVVRLAGLLILADLLADDVEPRPWAQP